MIRYSKFSDVITATITQPSLLLDGFTFAYWDYNTGITKNGSNEVSAWADLLGGANTLTPISGAKPVWSSSGITTLAAEAGLGTGAKTLSQPFTYYAVVNIITAASGKAFVDGNGALSACLYINNTNIDVSAYAGANSSSVRAIAGTTYVFRVLFNGANSYLQMNNNTRITGNFGAGNASGIKLGKNVNALFKGIIVRSKVDSSEDESSIYNFLVKKYGVI